MSGTWSTIYDKSWTNSDAEVVCRQLGHLMEGKGNQIIIIHRDDTLCCVSCFIQALTACIVFIPCI